MSCRVLHRNRRLDPRSFVRCRIAARLVFALLLSACGESEHGADVAAVPGTSAFFDLDANLGESATFYDFPYPSDLRLDMNGRPELTGFPTVPGNPILAPLKAIAGDRRGFATIPSAYFRFTGPLAPTAVSEVMPGSADAPVLLIDIDPHSPDRGRLLPTVAMPLPADPYAPAHLLAVGGARGIVLHAERTYAFVVRRSFGDADGAMLGVPESFARLRAGGTPMGVNGDRARLLYQPLWETLDRLGIAASEVAAATVFTTGDVVSDTAAMSTRVLARHHTAIEGLHLDPTDGADHEDYCELIGTARLPQFQTGVPPFDSGGLFVLDSEGVPIDQRDVQVPVTITLPRLPMPAGGYPLMIYFHGSGGLSSQVVDRGRISEPGGTAPPGTGPAAVVAPHGIATLAAALPLNPERLPGAANLAYINFTNLAAYRDTFRQGAIEQRLLIDAVSRLEIDPALLADCVAPDLLAGDGMLRFATEPMVALGQSMGAQYVNMVGAIEPRIGAVVPTGSGGLWSALVLEIELLPGVDTGAVIASLIGATPPLAHLHPALQLLELAWEPAEPLVYAARLAKQPLDGHPARSIYQPVGRDDSDFPESIFDGMALAYGNQQAGQALWPTMQATLALEGLDGLASYPVANNRMSENEAVFTGVVVQYDGDGIDDPHHIFAQLDAVKVQYACFFRSFFASGRSVVPAPMLPTGVCPP